MAHAGDVGTEIAPEVADDPELAADYHVDPRGRGLHGLDLAPGEVVRPTQAEVEAHPAWQGFGTQAADHPPMSELAAFAGATLDAFRAASRSA